MKEEFLGHKTENLQSVQDIGKRNWNEKWSSDVKDSWELSECKLTKKQRKKEKDSDENNKWAFSKNLQLTSYLMTDCFLSKTGNKAGCFEFTTPIQHNKS